jgi:hypothetical protein
VDTFTMTEKPTFTIGLLFSCKLRHSRECTESSGVAT